MSPDTQSTWAYQGVRKAGFSENFVFVLNEWTLFMYVLGKICNKF